ncbi:putative conjugative transposon TraM protein [Ostertagia ostertagi]
MNSASQAGYSPLQSRQQPTALKQDLDRLEKMMQSMSASAAEDPEMRQLDGMLEKIIDIQQPDRAKLKLHERSRANKGRVYAVDKPDATNPISILERNDLRSIPEKKFSSHQSNTAVENRFYDLTNDQPDDFAETAIPAVVHQTQTLVSGGTIKMRLTEDIYINGTLIPSGHFLFGSVTIAGERLKVEINSIRHNNQVFPVSLMVHDLDALEGIRIPGAITRDAAKDGSDRALQNIQFMSLDPSLATQAAGTGVEIAKGLFSKKAKLIRATVKQGHPILLVDTKKQ